MSSRRQYSDKEKAAYYKRKAQMVARPQKRRRTPVKRVRKNYKLNYPGVGRMIGSGIGSMGGNLIAPGVGGSIGGAIGGSLGNAAQHIVKRISGFGDYHVSRNSLVYNVDAVPEFSNDNERCTMICHREFISDIRSTQSFASQTYRINPAIASTFPWLSEIASNYEQYVVQGMVFEFKSTSATAVASTNTTLGTVVMATQYNSLSPVFANKQQMENYEFSQSSVPSQSILHPIECDPTQTQCGGVFNMYFPQDADGDTRLYDIGRFTIATVGMQADNAVIGELWVTYKICLLKPRLTSVSDVADFYQLDPATISATNPLGNLANVVPSPNNSNFTTLSNTNRVTLSDAFNGVVQVTLTYQLSTNTSILTMPYCLAGIGCTSVTNQYTALNTADQSVIPASNYNGTQTGFIKKNPSLSSGLSSYFNISTATIPANSVFSKAYLSIIAIPANQVTNPFP